MPDEISSGTPPVSLFSLAYSIKWALLIFYLYKGKIAQPVNSGPVCTAKADPSWTS